MTNDSGPTPRRSPAAKPPKVDDELAKRLDIEREVVGDVSARRVDVRQGQLREVHADVVNVRQAGLGRVSAHEVAILQSSVGAATGGTRRLGPNSAAGIVAGRDVTFDQSRAPIVLAGRRARVDQAAVGLVAAQRVSLRQSAAGVVFALKVTGDVRPLFGPAAALAFGAGFAIVLSVLQLFTRRQRPSLRLPRFRRHDPDGSPVVAVIRRRFKVMSGD
jgi:hypothetical protein